jgi:hypothetical protein
MEGFEQSGSVGRTALSDMNIFRHRAVLLDSMNHRIACIHRLNEVVEVPIDPTPR